jgi:RNA-binding protein
MGKNLENFWPALAPVAQHCAPIWAGGSNAALDTLIAPRTTVVSVLQEAGAILHLARSGRLIVQLMKPLPVGSVLVDAERRPVAKLLELLGPVRAPYGSAAPLTDRIHRAQKGRLFVQERS